jgi:uncharacterized protein YaaQ
MKLILAIIEPEDAKRVHKKLVEQKIFSTRLSSVGNFLLANQQTFLICVQNEDVEKVVALLKENSSVRKKVVPSSILSEYSKTSFIPIEVSVGGATIFILNVEDFIKL